MHNYSNFKDEQTVAQKNCVLPNTTKVAKSELGSKFGSKPHTFDSGSLALKLSLLTTMLYCWFMQSYKS